MAGTVNPDGGAITDCHFDYLTDAAYQANPPSNRFAGAGTANCDESLASLGSGHSPLPVHADLSGLQTPGVIYHFRLVAASANGTVNSSARTLTTPDKPTISDSWTDSATTDSATVKATINPKNADTTYHLEYGADNTYGHSSAEAPVGSDDAEHTVTATVPGLDPDTAYHYRIVATNPLGTVEGPDHVLATYPIQSLDTGCANQAYRSGPSAALPDCRAYEMVSPPDKNGFGILSFSNLAAAGGDRFTFTSLASFANPASSPYVSQYLSERGSSGWRAASISPPLRTPLLQGPTEGGIYPELKAFSADLCQAWLLHSAELTLAPGAVLGYPNLYRRQNCGASAGGYEALTTTAPPGFSAGEINGIYFPDVQGASADGSLTAFSADAKLTATASDATQTYQGQTVPVFQTYLATGGSLKLASVLPNGSAAQGNSSVGSNGIDVDRNPALNDPRRRLPCRLRRRLARLLDPRLHRHLDRHRPPLRAHRPRPRL